MHAVESASPLQYGEPPRYEDEDKFLYEDDA